MVVSLLSMSQQFPFSTRKKTKKAPEHGATPLCNTLFPKVSCLKQQFPGAKDAGAALLVAFDS